MSKITFRDEAEYEASYADKLSEAVASALAAQNKLISDLTAKLANAIPISDDYAPFAAFPDLAALVRKADMRPTSLPALVSLAVWKSSAEATDFPHWESASAILPTIPAGKKGERDLITVTRALENAASEFLKANTGLGIKVEVIRGTAKKPASAKARIFRFKPVEEVVEDASADTGDAEGDRQDEAA